jgi:uncharacterized protein (TIGR01777 family)
MKVKQFTFQSELPVSAQDVFAWHLRKGALERLIPPWIKSELLFPPGSPAEEGSQAGLKIKWGPFAFRWILEHRNCIQDQEFSDIQLRGPFLHYRHRHRFIKIDPISSKLSEEIEYSFPLMHRIVQNLFSRYFSWRHAIIRGDLKLIDHYERKPLRILLSGSSGLIGSNLKNFLQLAGHEVVRLVRRKEEVGIDAIYWDPVHDVVQKEDFEGFDAVIHLAGTGIAEGRWSKKKKEEIFLSRCRDTWLLSHILCRLYRPPKTLLCASGVGFYGNRGDEELTEESIRGNGFLAELCEKWEKGTEAIENRGTRVVHARFGAVLSAKGGMLEKILGPMRWGLGGKLGTGEQWVSWIGIDDLLGACYHCLMKNELSGAVNCVAPSPMTQVELVETVAKRIGRPAFCHLPSWFVKAAFGEMGEELLLSGQRVKPTKLLETGYVFRYPDLQTALAYTI